MSDEEVEGILDAGSYRKPNNRILQNLLGWRNCD
jgi:hypothetical protein